MNRKQFVILLVLVVVVGVAGLIIHRRGQASWQTAGQSLGQKLLPGLPVNDVAQIRIQSDTNHLNLARRDNLWRVHERGDYPADFSAISCLLLKFAELKIVQSQEVGPSQLGRFELLPPGAGTNSGTLVELNDNSGKTIATLLLGKNHLKKPAADSQFGGLGDAGWPDGRYVMVGTRAKTLALISDPLDNVQPKPDQWLNKEFLSIEKPCAISLQFTATTNSWKLTRATETNDWQLADAKPGEQLDTNKLYGVTNPFSSARFNDVAPLDTPTPSGSVANGTVLTVDTLDGFTYVARIGQKQDGNYPVRFAINAALPAERVAAPDEKAEDKAKLDKEFKERQAKLTEKLAGEKRFEKWIYYLPPYAIDSMIKPRGDLLVEPKKEAPKEAE